MKTYTEAPAIEKAAARMDTALRRIYSAASGILDGQESAYEAARDIQTMVLKAYGRYAATDWPHKEYPSLAYLTDEQLPQQ